VSTQRFIEGDVRACYEFLAHGARGVSEIRVIAPGHGIVGIGYFDNADAFVRACAEATGKGNVYVGIQPRPREFFTQAPNRLERLKCGARDEDIEWLSSIVIDIDPVRPKDTASTNEELARAIACGDRISDWLASKGFQRPVRNMSGNGCQLWFAVPPTMITDEQRAGLRDRLKHFETRIRDKFAGDGVAVDSIYNFSRIIKVIGTLSVKGEDTAERPHRVSYSLDAFERREDSGLLDALFRIPLPARSPSRSAEGSEVTVRAADQLSPMMQALLSAKTRLRALFEGRGKTAIGSDGAPLDTSSSGYDYSLVLKLVQMGITDPDELATVLWHRPNGEARAKGLRYIERTVQRALDLAKQSSQRTDASDAGDTRPKIQVNDRQLIDVVTDSWQALFAANNPPEFFIRNGELVRLKQTTGIPIIENASVDVVYGRLARVAKWIRLYEDRVLNVPPSEKVARDMRAYPDAALPEIDTVVLVPVFDKEGKLLAHPGYHPSAELWYQDTGVDIPEVPERPTTDDVQQARELLLDDLLGDFPFEKQSHRAHAMALLLLPFIRRMIPGCTPLHLVTAPDAGSGKGLLCHVLTRFAILGEAPPLVSLGAYEEETRKAITAYLLRGPQVIFIDNVEELKSIELTKALTGRVWSDRILGESRAVELPNKVAWVATGNNPLLSREISRRCIPIRIDADTEQPWLRSPDSFRRPNLVEFFETNLGRLVHAALVLIQSWIAAGQPRTAHTLGSFESWAVIMGSILDHVGIPGFLQDLEDIYEIADTESEELHEFVDAWSETFESEWVDCGKLLRLAVGQDLLPSILGEKPLRAQRSVLGKALTRLQGRRFGMRKLTIGRDEKVKRRLYALLDVPPRTPVDPFDSNEVTAKEHQCWDAEPPGPTTASYS
jgi:hypothetical protein